MHYPDVRHPGNGILGDGRLNMLKLMDEKGIMKDSCYIYLNV